MATKAYPHNVWTPIIGVQYLLLSLCLGLGSGNFWSRFAACFVGMVCVTIGVVWALARPNENGSSFWVEFQVWSTLLMLPMMAIGIVLLPSRVLVGQIECSASVASSHHFRILDILGITLVAALATVWIRLFRATSALRPEVHFTGLTFIITQSLFHMVEILAAAILVLGKRFRIASFVVLIAAIAEYRILLGGNSSAARLYDVQQWLVLLLTLLVFRTNGFSLSGSVFDKRDRPQSASSPTI